MKRHLLVLVALLFWFGGLFAQTNFIHQDSVFARTSDCTLGVSICIDSIAYDNINDLRFFVDGQQYSTQFAPCSVNTVHNYSYSDIFRGPENGPWRLDSWTVNGQTYSGTFGNLQTLLDSMRRWNPSGNWQLENSARIIYGYVAASTTYSCQEIFGTSRGGRSQVCYNSGVEYRGLRFNVPVGVHQFIVEKVRTGERDTITLLAACLKPETIRRTVNVGDNAVYCASLSDLLGTLTTTRNICPKPATSITFGTPQTTCMRYTGTTVGRDTACLEVCDRYGFCDTTYVIVTAATGTGSSLSFSDTVSVGLSRTTCEMALPTGTITSFTNICPQNSGSNISFTLDAGTSCVTYRGLSVGTNTACIRACNSNGVCDTTTLTIQAIPLVNPTTPTRFTFIDTITVGLSRNKCSFNAPTGAITVFQNICASNSGTNIAFTLDQATKCVTYRSLAIGIDTACIRVCNAVGKCDTTYMYVGAIVNGNGGGTNNGTGRTIVVRDTISIGLTRENCGISVPATILSITNICPQNSGTNVAFLIDPIRRCVTYRGVSVGADTACYVVCNANGVCDTTQYIVNGLDTVNRGKKIVIRDTISVGLTRRDCRVSIPRGVYQSITNDCPQSSGTNIAFTYDAATRCAGYTGLLVGADTACIKVCTTEGVCDTTLFIITAIENTTGGGGSNRCGLRVTPIVQSRSCAFKGAITLAVSGSTAPYTFRWADLTGTNQPQNRTELEAGNYTVTVSPSVANCDTILTVTVINNATNCGGVGGNRCGLTVVPTSVAKTCAANGSITLTVTGSTAPYTFDWTDLVGTSDPRNRTNLEAGIYSVLVSPSTPNCDTLIAVVVANNAVNCGGGGGTGNRCGLVVTPTATPKTCTADGEITLAVSGSIAPYTFDWSDLTGTTDPQNRTALAAGTYTVKVTPSVLNCDTTLSIVVANNATNCGGGGGNGSNIRLATVTVQVQDSTTYCVDSSRVTGGFTVILTASQTFSTIAQATPKGCFKIRGFVVGQDSALIILVGQNGVRDTTKLTINVTPRGGGGGGTGNRCGLVVTPTATPKTCAVGGSITLAVSGSTGSYTFDWADLTGTNDPQNRPILDGGTYSVKVTPSVPNCDTTLSIVVVNNCVANRCGLIVVSTITPKTCASNGSITLTGTGSTAPYVFNWSDLTGSGQPQNRTNLNAGSYTVTITPSTPNCDTIVTLVVPNNATNCNGSNIRLATVNVQVQDSTTFCVDSSRVAGGFTVILSSPQTFSTIAPITPLGCYKIKGFVVGQDSALIILVGRNGVRDTTKLTINVTPRGGSRCGLVVTPTTTPRGCVLNGSITLAVSGSTAPYTFSWTDLTGSTQPQNRTNLTAGAYTVKVASSAANCDTTLTIRVADNCVANRCGLIVLSTTTPKTCTTNGSITLGVSGSTAPYTYTWSDSATVSNPQVRTNLAAGTYTVKVAPSVPNCDTTLTITVANNATNCNAGNTCGLIVSSTAVPKNCTARGSITLTVSGGTAPYSYNWADLNGTSFPKNRTNLEAGIYVVTITSASPNCDSVLRITVANDSGNCTTNRIRTDSVTVQVGDSTRYCVDSSRVLGGFTVLVTSPQVFSTIAQATPKGCFIIKGFVVGRDTATIVLVGQNGTRDTMRLITKVIPKGVLTPRSDTISLKILETKTYCPDSSRLRGAPINLIKFCSTDPFNNTTIRLDTVRKCVSVTGVSTGQDTFCIAVCNTAGFCDTTKLFVNVTRDTVTPQYRTDTVRLFVGDSLTYCNIDTGMIRGVVDTIYNACPTSSGINASVEITAAKCLKIKGLRVGVNKACIVVCNRRSNLCDTTEVQIIVTTKPVIITGPRKDSITIQVNEARKYCPDTSRLRGAVVTSISTCVPVLVDNSIVFLVDSTKCVDVEGVSVGRDTVCLVVCNANRVCDTTTLIIKVVPERLLASSTVVVPVQLTKDSIFCGVDTTQLRGRVDTIYDVCPAKNGTKARMVIDRTTKCVKITGVNVGRDTMCVVVCNRTTRICDTTFVIAVVSDTAGGRIIVIANDDFDSLRRGTNKTLELYNNDTLRPRRPTSLTIIQPPVKGTADTISFRDGLVKYTASRSPSACGLDSFKYRVCIDAVCDTALVVIKIVCPDSLQVFSAISPNGDGRNDVLFVDGLQNYPDNTMCVFNRWGNQVLNQKNYQNDWGGTWNGTNLPDGTYFYFIRDDAKGEILKKGYIQIIR